MNNLNKHILESIIKRIDEQIKNPILREAADEVEDSQKRMSAKEMQAKDYESLFGVKPDLSRVSTVPRISRYANVAIDPMYSFLQEDAAGKKVIDHAILREMIEQNYFIYTSTRAKLPVGVELSDEELARFSSKKVLEPSPVMLWGAPGIGKSQGVLAGAINCARKVAKNNGQKFVYLEEDEIEEVFNKPIEEHKGNLYFIAWNDAQEKEKETTLFGKIQWDEDGNPIYNSNLRVPAENLFIFFDVRVAGMSDGDLLGIPMRTDKTVINAAGGKVKKPTLNMDRLPFLKLCCDEKKLHGVIMWDEINQGSEGIKSALYSVICERYVGEAKLAPGIANFAAANGKYWAPDATLPKALSDRFGANYLYVSPTEWIETFKKKGLMKPVMERFIKQNPLISFYMTEEGWEKFYVPLFANMENRPSSMGEYIRSEEFKFPSPRNLTKVLMFINDKLEQIKAGELDWDTGQLADSIAAYAGSWCGPVVEEQLKDFIFKAFSVKWDVMVEDQDYAVQQATDMETQDIVRGIIKDHFKELIDLSLAVHADESNTKPSTAKTKKAYLGLLEEVMRVMVNIASSEVDFLCATLRNAREEYISEHKTGDSTNDRIRIEKAISQIVSDGRTIVPDPKWQAKASEMIKKVLTALVELAKAEAEAGREPTSLVTQPVTTTQTPSAAAPTSTMSSATSSIPEKYSRFNSIFEEMSNSINPLSSEPAHAEPPIDPEVQVRAIKEIIHNIVGDGKQPLVAEDVDDIKARNRIILDKINHAILNNTTLTKRQKQKLISSIKKMPEAISVLLTLKGYETKAYIL